MGAQADSIEALLSIGREGHSDLVSVVASTLEVTRRTGMRPGDEAGHVRSMAALFHQEGEFALERTLRERAVALLQSEMANEAAAVGAAYDASECASAGALAESRIELQDLLGEHLGQKEEARVLLAAALSSAIEAFGGDDPRVAQILCRQGEQLWKKREGIASSVEEALGLFEEAHRIFEYSHGPDSITVGRCQRYLAIARAAKGEFPRAMALAADALRISKLHIMGVGTEHYGDHADAVLALVNIAADDADNGSTTMLTRANLLGFALWQAGRYGEGLRVLRDMVGILEATGVPSTSHIGAHARFNMALCLRDQSAVLRSTCESVIESVIEEGTDTGSVDGEGGVEGGAEGGVEGGAEEGGAEEGVHGGVQEVDQEGSEEGVGEEEGVGKKAEGEEMFLRACEMASSALEIMEAACGAGDPCVQSLTALFPGLDEQKAKKRRISYILDNFLQDVPIEQLRERLKDHRFGSTAIRDGDLPNGVAACGPERIKAVAHCLRLRLATLLSSHANGEATAANAVRDAERKRGGWEAAPPPPPPPPSCRLCFLVKGHRPSCLLVGT